MPRKILMTMLIGNERFIDPLYLVMGRWVPEIRFLFSDIVHVFYAYPTLND